MESLTPSGVNWGRIVSWVCSGTYHLAWAAGRGDRGPWPGRGPTQPLPKWSPPAPSSEPAGSARTSPAARWYDDEHLHISLNHNTHLTRTHSHASSPTSTICAPGLMPTVWAALPSVTRCTNTPVLLPPTTVSWLSSASPWREMVSTRPLTRMAFGRDRIRKGGADVLDKLHEEQGQERWV